MGMIESLPNRILASAFQGSSVGEGQDDQSIFFTLSYDQGQTWSNSTIIQSHIRACWGPVLFWDQSGQKLWFFYSQSVPENYREPNRSYPGGDIFYRTTTPGSNYSEWTNPVLILPWASEKRGNVSKMTANRLIKTKSGRWILPFWQEPRTKNDTGPGVCGVLISENQGKSFEPYGEIFVEPLENTNSSNKSVIQASLIEGSVAELQDNRIYQVFRTPFKFIYKSISLDGGKTWPQAVPINLYNPDSKVSILSTQPKNDEIIIAFNPSISQRLPLRLSKSDQGISWQTIQDIDTDPASNHFSYPTVLQFENKIYTIYTAQGGMKLAITTNY